MLYSILGAVAFLSLCALTMADAAAADENPVVVMDTSMGPITIELNRAKAPISVDNFLKYVDANFYDGLIFHRVMDGFMIQGGGMDDKMTEKKTFPPIKNEASNGLSNARGTIAMARTSVPDSATSQFFINHGPSNARGLDAGGPAGAGYAVFGKVTDGMETVDAIAKVPTTNRGGHGDVPVKPIYIKSVKRKAKS